MKKNNPLIKPFELKIHERKHEAISRVNNNQVCERRILKEDRHERNQNGLNKERHQRPHFDKANRRENSKRNTERKERSNREPRTKEQRSENRNKIVFVYTKTRTLNKLLSPVFKYAPLH